MNRYRNQIYLLLLVVALWLYFFAGWVVVAIYLVAVATLWLYLYFRRQKGSKRVETRVSSTPVEEMSDMFAKRVARRKSQGEILRAFAVAVTGCDKRLDRVAARMMDWHLEYSRANGYYDVDLYDFILDKCKERLTTAEAAYLKSELRLTISIVRQFMRGRSVDEVVGTLKTEEGANN